MNKYKFVDIVESFFEDTFMNLLFVALYLVLLSMSIMGIILMFRSQILMGLLCQWVWLFLGPISWGLFKEFILHIPSEDNSQNWM